MDIINIILAIRIAFGLTIGVYLANRWKEIFRGIVIRCMPIKHRISERSYILQTRITSMVGIIFAILVAGIINIVMAIGWQKMGWQSGLQQQTVTPKLIPIPANPVVPNLPKKEILEEEETSTPEDIIIPTKVPIPKKSISTTSYYPREVPPLEVQYVTKPSTYYQPMALPVYLQIYAFTSYPKAQQQRARWIGQTPFPVKVGYRANDYTPYKVVIGPFPSRQAANHFKNKITIPAFIRPIEGLQFFE